MCQDFRRGQCARGVNCRFAHGEDDERQMVDGSYAFKPVRQDDFEKQILGKNIDRAALCGCSPYSFLEGTRSETLGPLTKAGYKLKRTEAMQEQWNRLPQREKDGFGFEREAQDLLQAVQDAMDAQIEEKRHEFEAEWESAKAIAEQTGEGKLPSRKQVDTTSGFEFDDSMGREELDDLEQTKHHACWMAIRDILGRLKARGLPPLGTNGYGKKLLDEREGKNERGVWQSKTDDRGDRSGGGGGL